MSPNSMNSVKTLEKSQIICLKYQYTVGHSGNANIIQYFSCHYVQRESNAFNFDSAKMCNFNKRICSNTIEQSMPLITPWEG